MLFSRGYVDHDARPEPVESLGRSTSTASGCASSPTARGTTRRRSGRPTASGSRFCRTDRASSQLHVMWVDTRETLQLTRLERAPGVDHLVAGRQADRVHEPRSRRVADSAGAAAAGAARRAARARRGRDRSSVLGVGRHPGPTTKGYTHVFVVDATRRRHAAAGDDRQFQPLARRRGPPTARSIFVSGIRKPDAEYLQRRLRDLRRQPRDRATSRR